MRAIKENVRVEKEGTIELRHPELTAGSQAEVIILIEKPEQSTATAPGQQAQAPIWKVAEEIARAVPDEEWRKLPRDLSRNLDHYLYGTPKDED